ncbi:hypothetical protein B0T22DRAFT_472632 [Podospora appendiculata]|uniref:Apple domain-containing protein n=1 Tax=Podospora appendiculata TaxID=314037 RepID=A0AAE1C7L1_9PEZI|nr:hypothetical protein B0T22DRAFT_472632 [Podospora appendiculata]
MHIASTILLGLAVVLGLGPGRCLAASVNGKGPSLTAPTTTFSTSTVRTVPFLYPKSLIKRDSSSSSGFATLTTTNTSTISSSTLTVGVMATAMVTATAKITTVTVERWTCNDTLAATPTNGTILPSVSASAAPSQSVITTACPVSDNSSMATTNGANFQLSCHTQCHGTVINVTSVATINGSIGAISCAETCSRISSCTAFSWVIATQGTSDCTLIEAPHNGTTVSEFLSGSRTVPPSLSTGMNCLASNGTTYTTPGGYNYTVYCSQTYGGPDLELSYQPSWQQCALHCSSFPVCVGFSFVAGMKPEQGTNCALKGSLANVQTGDLGTGHQSGILIGVPKNAVMNSGMNSSSTVDATTPLAVSSPTMTDNVSSLSSTVSLPSTTADLFSSSSTAADMSSTVSPAAGEPSSVLPFQTETSLDSTETADASAPLLSMSFTSSQSSAAFGAAAASPTDSGFGFPSSTDVITPPLTDTSTPSLTDTNTPSVTDTSTPSPANTVAPTTSETENAIIPATK